MPSTSPEGSRVPRSHPGRPGRPARCPAPARRGPGCPGRTLAGQGGPHGAQHRPGGVQGAQARPGSRWPAPWPLSRQGSGPNTSQEGQGRAGRPLVRWRLPHTGREPGRPGARPGVAREAPGQEGRRGPAANSTRRPTDCVRFPDRTTPCGAALRHRISGRLETGPAAPARKPSRPVRRSAGTDTPPRSRCRLVSAAAPAGPGRTTSSRYAPPPAGGYCYFPQMPELAREADFGTQIGREGRKTPEIASPCISHAEKNHGAAVYIRVVPGFRTRGDADESKNLAADNDQRPPDRGGMIGRGSEPSTSTIANKSVSNAS